MDGAFSFGNVEYPSGGQYGPLKKSYAMLVYIKQGEVEISCDDQTFLIKDNQVACFTNKKNLTLNYKKGISTDSFWCETYADSLSSYTQKLINSNPQVIELNNDLDCILKLGLNQLSYKSSNATHYKDSLGEAIFQAFFMAADIKIEEQQMPRSILAAKKYINDNLPQNLTLNAIANEAAVCPHHLIHNFKKYCGITPIRYMWKQRLNKGLMLLKTGLSISEIALQCGYKNQFHFSKQVKDAYDISPTQIRKQKGLNSKITMGENAESIHFTK